MVGGKKCNHIIGIARDGWNTKDIKQRSAVNLLFGISKKDYNRHGKDWSFFPHLMLDKRSKVYFKTYSYCPQCGEKITSIPKIKRKLKEKWFHFRFINDL